MNNWSGLDLGILGFIGVGFTPQELDTLDGFNNDVFAAFGAAHGWSPEQVSCTCYYYTCTIKI